jgi:hypothetical protein
MFRSFVVFFLCGGVAMAQGHPSKGRCAPESAEVRKLQGWVSYDKGAKSPDLSVNVSKLAAAASLLEKCRNDAAANKESSASGGHSDQTSKGSGYRSNPTPFYTPPPMVLRFPPPMPVREPIPVPEFHPPRFYNLSTVSPTPASPGVRPATPPGNSFSCEEKQAAHDEEIQKEENLRQMEFNLQNLQFQYQNALISAQNAEQAASSLGGSLPGGALGWIIAGTSMLSSLNAMQLRSQAQNLEWQVSSLQFQVDMARSSLNMQRIGGYTSGQAPGSNDCDEPLSPEVLKALKTLGIQCFQGGELNSIMSSIRPGVHGDSGAGVRGQLISPPNGNPTVSRQAITSAISVGGISHLEDVEAAVYRPDKQDLLLIGPLASEAGGLSPDDWTVTYRSVLGTEPLGISIDPGPDPREMAVRYLGGSRGTNLGNTFFEADRTLKILSSGFDNLSCSAWSSMPRDFPTELDLMEADLRAGTDLSDGGWHRFWFTPPDVPVEITRDGHGILVPKNRWIVQEQSVPAGRLSPPSARRFAENLSGKFLELRESIPAFAELHRVASLVYVAKWIRDKQIPGEAAWKGRSIDPVPTPLTTPSIAVLKGTASGRSFLRYGIQGGVDFYPPNHYTSASPGLAALIQRANQAEVRGALSWSFSVEGNRYSAVRLKYDHPIPSGPDWAVTPRSEAVMKQPPVQTMQLPRREVQIKNETGEPLRVEFSGPMQMTSELRTNETATVELTPGVYKATPKAGCGTETFSIDLTEKSNVLRTSCHTLGPIVSPIRLN